MSRITCLLNVIDLSCLLCTYQGKCVCMTYTCTHFLLIRQLNRIQAYVHTQCHAQYTYMHMCTHAKVQMHMRTHTHVYAYKPTIQHKHTHQCTWCKQPKIILLPDTQQTSTHSKVHIHTQPHKHNAPAECTLTEIIVKLSSSSRSA